jgi:hypothetical protein
MVSDTHDILTARVKACEQSREAMKRQWYTNVAYFKGYQWVDDSLAVGRYWSLNSPAKIPKNRVTKNYTRVVAMTMAAKLTQNRPSQTVLPATLEEDDKRRARCSQKLLDYSWEILDCQEKLYKAALWMVLTGTGIWAVYWDDEAGDDMVVTDPISGEVISTMRTGAPIVEPVSPFDIGFDPLADDPDQAEWAYRSRLVSKAWIKKCLNRTPKDAGSVNVGEPDLQNRKEGAPYLDLNNEEDVKSGYYTLYEFYDVVKHKCYWFTKDEVLYIQDWKGKIPFLVARAIPNMGDVEGTQIGSNGAWGETPISDVVPLQFQLNVAESQMVELKNHLVFPPLLVPMTSHIDVSGMVSGAPRKVIRWSGTGMPPTPINLGHMPAWLPAFTQSQVQAIMDMGGIHELSIGQNPGSIQSGRGLAILAEMDATKFGPWVRALGKLIRDAGVRMLQLYKQYGKAPMILKVIGESGSLDLDAFDTGDINSFDVRVQEGSTFAMNKSLRTDQILQLWQLGLIQDPRKILKMLEFATLEEAQGTINEDKLKQEREIKRILDDDRTVQVDPFDDHAVHADTIALFMKSITFERLPENIKVALIQHWQMHNQAMQPQVDAQSQAATQRGVAASGAAKVEGGFSPTQNSGLNQMQEAFPASGAATAGGMQ